MNTFDHLVIETLSPEAEVRVGRNCTLGGLTIRCRGKVIIGDNVLAAGNLIQDVVIASPNPVSSAGNADDAPSIIRIGNNVWLAAQSIILEDGTVGDGGVIGVNGLLFHASVRENCLVVGNPVSRPIPIDKIIELQRAID